MTPTGYADHVEEFNAKKGSVCQVCGDVAVCWCGSCSEHCPDRKTHNQAMQREKPITQPPQEVHTPLPKDHVKAWAIACFGYSKSA